MPGNEEEIQTRKRRRSHAKGKFHRVKRVFVESFNDEQCCVLQDIARDLETAYNELESRNNELHGTNG